jgi:hypothetical protein
MSFNSRNAIQKERKINMDKAAIVTMLMPYTHHEEKLNPVGAALVKATKKAIKQK